MTETTHRYLILNADGVALGVYDADSPEDAIKALFADAGSDYSEADPGLRAMTVEDAAEWYDDPQELARALDADLDMDWGCGVTTYTFHDGAVLTYANGEVEFASKGGAQ